MSDSRISFGFWAIGTTLFAGWFFVLPVWSVYQVPLDERIEQARGRRSDIYKLSPEERGKFFSKVQGRGRRDNSRLDLGGAEVPDGQNNDFEGLDLELPDDSAKASGRVLISRTELAEIEPALRNKSRYRYQLPGSSGSNSVPKALRGNMLQRLSLRERRGLLGSMGFSDNGVRGSLSVTVPDAPQYDLSRGGSSRQRSLSSVSSDSAEDTLQGLSSSPELSGASIARGQNATLDGLLQDNLSPRKVFISSKNERRLSLENKAKRPKFSLSSLWPFRKKRSKMAADRVFYPVR